MNKTGLMSSCSVTCTQPSNIQEIPELQKWNKINWVKSLSYARQTWKPVSIFKKEGGTKYLRKLDFVELSWDDWIQVGLLGRDVFGLIILTLFACLQLLPLSAQIVWVIQFLGKRVVIANRSRLSHVVLNLIDVWRWTGKSKNGGWRLFTRTVPTAFCVTRTAPTTVSNSNKKHWAIKCNLAPI